jgi:hypothetical protein
MGSENWSSEDWYKRYRTEKRLGERNERLVQTLWAGFNPLAHA